MLVLGLGLGLGSMCVGALCLFAQSCPTLRDPKNHSPPGSPVQAGSPGKNIRVGCHALLQGIFPTQGLSPGLPHCRRILYCLSHLGSPVCVGFGHKSVSQNLAAGKVQ